MDSQSHEEEKADCPLLHEQAWCNLVESIVNELDKGKTLAEIAHALTIEYRDASRAVREFLASSQFGIDSVCQLKNYMQRHPGVVQQSINALMEGVQFSPPILVIRTEGGKKEKLVPRYLRIREAAERLHLSIETVRRHWKTDGKIEIPEDFITLKEVVDLPEFQHLKPKIDKWRASGLFVFRSAFGLYFVDNEGFAELAYLIELESAMRVSVCVCCGKEFQSKRLRKYCTHRCFTRTRHNRLVASGYSIKEPQGWHARLAEALADKQGLGGSPQEGWLTLAQARRLTGLTAMQVGWLGKTGLVTTRPHPTKLWRGTPVTQYAASELEVVKKVYQDWQGQHPKKIP
ncbi:MAG TPA: hypothetical protein VLA04_06415 [Verrucomicrobiae bacterium]|nr:hypothetical protein [Verrucomicrobiae bacterium]